MMVITCTPVTLEKEYLEKKLNTRTFFDLGCLMTRGYPVTKIELKYVEYLMLDYKMKLGRRVKDLFMGREYEETNRIRLIGNGSTGSVSFLEEIPLTQTIEVPESMIQPKDYGPEDMKKDAYRVAAIVCRKLTGRCCQEIQVNGVSSIYRPFWAVYYGTPRKDGKILCRPYGADGFTIKS